MACRPALALRGPQRPEHGRGTDKKTDTVHPKNSARMGSHGVLKRPLTHSRGVGGLGAIGRANQEGKSDFLGRGDGCAKT